MQASFDVDKIGTQIVVNFQHFETYNYNLLAKIESSNV